MEHMRRVEQRVRDRAVGESRMPGSLSNDSLIPIEQLRLLRIQQELEREKLSLQFRAERV